MIKNLLIASNNTDKAKEIKEVLKDLQIEALTLKEAGIGVEVNEDGKTLEENSYKKAKAVFDLKPVPVIADDTGLFVDALNGRPGVYSARYAGENVTYDDNCDKLLLELNDIPDEKRTAEFRTVLCLIPTKNEHYFFEGICRGKILDERKGANGFGYDPLFVPNGYSESFAEMSPEEKNKISHRAKALMKLKKFIASKVRG